MAKNTASSSLGLTAHVAPETRASRVASRSVFAFPPGGRTWPRARPEDSYGVREFLDRARRFPVGWAEEMPVQLGGAPTSQGEKLGASTFKGVSNGSPYTTKGPPLDTP